MNRWRELKLEERSGALTLKKLFTTRGTSRIDAVHVVRISLPSDKRNERDASSDLREKMDSYEFIVFIVFRARILRAFNSWSTELQPPRMDLSCMQYLRDNRESVLETAIANSWNDKVAFSFSGKFIDAANSFKINIFYRTN